MKLSAQEIGTFGLQVGNVVLDGRAFLAPMSGVSDALMRRIAARFGASMVVSEMVASGDFVRGGDESRIRAAGAGVDPHVVQIAGCDPVGMGEAARLAEASGAGIIDINMGCPAKRVTGGFAGSALMRAPDLALRLIEATVAAVKIPVTLKMRLGWDDTNRNAATLAAAAENAGVQMITVHARTRCQFYTGRADWAAIGEVSRAVRVPVVANGDCADLASAKAMLRASGAQAVMIGRAAVGRPWLIGELAAGLAGRPWTAPDAATRLAAAIEHFDGLLGLLGANSGLRHARKHLAAYADAAGGVATPDWVQDRRRLVTSESPGEVRQLLTSLLLSHDVSAAPVAADMAA